MVAPPCRSATMDAAGGWTAPIIMRHTVSFIDCGVYSLCDGHQVSSSPPLAPGERMSHSARESSVCTMPCARVRGTRQAPWRTASLASVLPVSHSPGKVPGAVWVQGLYCKRCAMRVPHYVHIQAFAGAVPALHVHLQGSAWPQRYSIVLSPLCIMGYKTVSLFLDSRG